MKKLSIIALTATAFMLSGAIAQNASMKPTIIRHENKVLRAEDATKHSVKAAGMHFWNQGWISNGAITLDLETIEGDNGFGVFSSVEMLTPDIKTEQYDPYGNPLAFEYGPEGYCKGLAYNRTKGIDYTGRMYKVPKGMSFKMGAAWQGVNDYVDHTFTISEDAYFICNLAAGVEGAFETLQNPTDLTLNLEDMSLELNAKTKLTATPVGETNATVHYSSSNPNVATVSSDGEITVVGAGEANIIANCGLVKKSIKITGTSAEHKQTGIKVVKGATITTYAGEGYNLSQLKVVKVYNDQPEGEEITLTSAMISGEFNKDVAGEYTLTITSGEFTTTFKVIVKSLFNFDATELKKGYNFGNNSGWGNFYFWGDAIASSEVPTQYLNLKEEQLADVNNYVLINGNKNAIKSIKNLGGTRYEFWYNDDVLSSLKAGDTIELAKGMPLYYYSGTVSQAHDSQGDGEFQVIGRSTKSYKFVYTNNKDYEVFTAAASELTLNQESLDISIGEESVITYQIGPAGAYGTPSFESKDASIATVDASGRVVGIKEGSTTIVVKLGSISKEVSVTVSKEKTIKAIMLTNIPTTYSVLKGSKKAFAPQIKTAKFIFDDNSLGKEFTLSEEQVAIGTLDVNKVGKVDLPVTITIEGEEYKTSIEVNVYEREEQKADQLAVVDWFNYAMFAQFPSTSSNARGNFTAGGEAGQATITEVESGKSIKELLKEQQDLITYTRKDGTNVKVTGTYQLQTNIAIFPEFLNEVKDETGKVTHEAIGKENYNKKGYYEEGDTVTIKKGVPLMKWTGDVGVTDATLIEGTGELIIEGYTQEDLVYKFTNDKWSFWKEYTDMQLASTTLEMEVGQSKAINVKRVPNDATQGSFTFVSSDPSVCTVNSHGVVKGLKEGTATITITLADENDPSKTKTATVTVTIKAKSTPTPTPSSSEEKPGETPSENKGGCGGSIAATSGIISGLAIAGAAIVGVIENKKKKNK